MNIAQLKAAHEATKKGSWIHDKAFDAIVHISDNKVKAIADFGKIDHHEADADFIVLAHEMWPKLLEAVKVVEHVLEMSEDGGSMEDLSFDWMRHVLTDIKGA